MNNLTYDQMFEVLQALRDQQRKWEDFVNGVHYKPDDASLAFLYTAALLRVNDLRQLIGDTYCAVEPLMREVQRRKREIEENAKRKAEEERIYAEAQAAAQDVQDALALRDATFGGDTEVGALPDHGDPSVQHPQRTDESVQCGTEGTGSPQD